MSILFTADLHLNNLARDNYRHDWQIRLRKLVMAHKVSTVIINGDLTDEKDHHAATLVNKVVEHIDALANLAAVVINVGNHDYTSLTATPFFAFLSKIPNIVWVGKPTPMEIEDWHFLFLPHSPNPKRDWQGEKLEDYSWIIAHQTFEGTYGDSGKVLSGVPLDMLPEDAAVLCGDVHTPQQNGPVTYIGAPYLVDFGDDYNPRVLLLKEKLTSIPCDGPQKRLVEVRAGELPALQAKKTLEKLNKGDILKVRVELDIGQYARWGEFKDKVYDWGAKHGFIIHMVQPVTKHTVTKQKLVKRQAPKSDIELLKSYAKSKEIDERTIKVGLELLKVA